MPQGTVALVAWLGLISVLFMVILGLIAKAGNVHGDGAQPWGFIESGWWYMVTLLGGFDYTPGWPFGLMYFAVILGGIFLVSTFIGLLTTGIETKLSDLRKGHSLVVEENHTVILGWTSQIFAIISELVTANANRTHACIAILADTDNVQMEDEIRARVGKTGSTGIVCRSGSPMDLAELEMINPHASKSIIILSPDTTDPDSQVIKTILVLTNNPHRR